MQTHDHIALSDDGTLDTVFHCSRCQTDIRFDSMESYRDHSGALSVEALAYVAEVHDEECEAPNRIERAKQLAEERFGRLDCDTVNAKAIDVTWSVAFGAQRDSDGGWEEDPRAELVYPDFSELELETVLKYIDERDSTDEDEFRRRLAGLDDEDAAELEALDEKALRGPILNPLGNACFGHFARRWTDDDHERAKQLRTERDNEREELEDVRPDIDMRAAELAEEDPSEWEPMMDYAYPLGGGRVDAGTAQALLWDKVGPVVVVYLDGEPHLALSGGGMDLSWEICEAYALLGFRPPLEFCDLPRMAGRGESDRDLAIVGACIGSAEIAAKWAQGTVDRLTENFGEVI